MNSEIEKIWKKSSWTVEARQIIEAISDFPKNSKIIMILRHSHRKDTDNMEEMSKLGLTPQGQKIAKIFGRNLPKHRKIRLFFSVVPRCRETAESIIQGFKEIRGNGTLIGALEPLYKFSNDGEFVLKQAFKYPGPKFINRWAAGLFPPKSIISFTKYCQSSAVNIWTQNKDKNSNIIDIHITHDLVLLALKLGWFGISPNDKWISYLGGFAFTLQQNKIKLHDGKRIIELEYPYWWQRT